jgi:hypothetical protein
MALNILSTNPHVFCEDFITEILTNYVIAQHNNSFKYPLKTLFNYVITSETGIAPTELFLSPLNVSLSVF